VKLIVIAQSLIPLAHKVTICVLEHLAEPVTATAVTTTPLNYYLATTTSQLEMWANAQRHGRPAEYRGHPLFNAAVWLTLEM